MASKKRLYNILMKHEAPKAVWGYPIEIVPGIKTFYYKSEESGLFVICEYYSGQTIAAQFTRKNAVVDANKKLNSMDPIAINRMVAEAIKDKNNGIKLNE